MSSADPPESPNSDEDYHRFAVGCFWAVPLSVGLWALILYVLLMWLA